MRRPSIVIPAAAGLPDLDAAAVWIVGALRHLSRSIGERAQLAWRWLDAVDDLRTQAVILRDHGAPPANCCPLIPIRMPVEVALHPGPGQALPVEHEERQIAAMDNRRLAGKVAMVLTDNIWLNCKAAESLLERAPEDDLQAQQRAEDLATKALDLARQSLRLVDLDELQRAVRVEVDACRPQAAPTTPKPSAQPPARQVEVQFLGETIGVVREDSNVVEVRGQKQVWVFRKVVEAAGTTVGWMDLVRAAMAESGVELERRLRSSPHRVREDDEDDDEEQDGDGDMVMPATPRCATRPDSMQRTGNRIRRALGKLSYHWHQDGLGARWSADCS